jgi:hypothetical protein
VNVKGIAKSYRFGSARRARERRSSSFTLIVYSTTLASSLGKSQSHVPFCLED